MSKNKNPGGKYFNGYNFMYRDTETSKGAAKETAATFRKRGFHARVTKNSRYGWDVWARKP